LQCALKFSGVIIAEVKKMEVHEMPVESRPRERLLAVGPDALSDAELVSILLGSGIKGNGVFSLSRQVLSFLDSKSYNVAASDLTAIAGLGNAKAALIVSAFELARRTLCPEKKRIRLPQDALGLVRHYADREQEYFLAISLNGAHEVKAVRVVSIGLVNRTLIHPREVFAGAITDRATAVICAHNHPSGNTEPSPEDREITAMLVSAGKLLGINVLDHIIFSATGYFSFQENGDL
jgi:DNA repair protein RadC